MLLISTMNAFNFDIRKRFFDIRKSFSDIRNKLHSVHLLTFIFDISNSFSDIINAFISDIRIKWVPVTGACTDCMSKNGGHGRK